MCQIQDFPEVGCQLLIWCFVNLIYYVFILLSFRGGYPDPTYMDRVAAALQQAGIRHDH